MTSTLTTKLLESRPLSDGLFAKPQAPSKKEVDGCELFEGRMDVVGFEQRPKVFFIPSWTEFSLTHPKVAAAGQGGALGVLVIDIDELATVGSSSSKAAAQGALAAQAALLGLSAFLAFWFGTRTSVNQILETTEALRDLGVEKKEILEAAKAAGRASLSEAVYRDLQNNIRLLLEENRGTTTEAKISRIFSGYVSGAATAVMGTGAILEMPVYVSPLVGAAGALLLQISAPAMSVFALASAGQQAYRAYETTPTLKALERLVPKTTDPATLQAYALLSDRLKTIRAVASARSASWAAMGIGVPLAIFGGPIGLAVLLPGVIGCIASAYIDSSKVEYTPQLTWKDKLALDSNESIVNAILTARSQFDLLKHLKNQKPLLYPKGGEGPAPIRWVSRLIASIRRKGGAAKKYPSAKETVSAYVIERGRLEIASLTKDREVASARALQFLGAHPDKTHWTIDEQLEHGELQRRITAHDTRLKELDLEQRLLSTPSMVPSPAKATASHDSSVFGLVRFFIRMGLFNVLSEKIMKDKGLLRVFLRSGVVSIDGDEHHLNANKLILALTDTGSLSITDQKYVAGRLFELAEEALFTVQLGREQSRERQLLDWLGLRITE